jgi:hypothetical protein
MGPGSAGRREIDGTPRAGFQKRGPAPARRRSGAPRGARVQKCARHDQTDAPFGAPLPRFLCGGKMVFPRKRGRIRRPRAAKNRGDNARLRL